MSRLQLTEVIERFKACHGEAYDYSKVEYISQADPVIIICKKHHVEFTMRPVKHWSGFCGCKLCSVESRKNTNLERYGFCNFLQQSNRDNLKRIWKESLGVENPFQNSEIKDKIKQTNLERYGVENVSSNDSIKDRKKESCIKKFGVENAYQSEEIKIKIKQTNLQRYGVEHHINNVSIQNKIKQTNLERYGVEFALQNSDIREKQLKSSYNFKSFILPSGKEILLQGYEPQVLNFIFLNNLFLESDFDFMSKVSIPYFNKSNRKYFPDFILPKYNLVIEVKSIYTYFKNLEINLIKRQACIDLGYNFKFYIWNKHTIMVI